MTTVTVTLPYNTPPSVVDAISVSVMNNTMDRQPRSTFLEGMDRTNTEVLILTFRT